MDKKILLGGAAALIMGASIFAAPASANISYSWGGDAKLTATMDDACNLNGADLDDNAAFGNAANGATTAPTACSGNEESPVWATSSKLEWEAAGTLANGLSVSANQDKEIGLSGAFGSVTFATDGDSAAKAAFAAGDGDIDVTGDNLGGHTLSTDGTKGMVVTYQAPSVGGMDLYLSYAPNSEALSTDGDADYVDTIGFGASFGMDAMSISAGWESATANTGGGAECTAHTKALTDQATAAVLATQADELAGGAICGDMTVIAVGATLDAGDLSLNAGWSQLDSEEADRTTMSIGLGMDVGAYSLSLDYVNATKDYFRAVSDDQTVIGVGVGTSLGDGVDLGLAFSNNSYNVAGTGAHTNYRAELELKISY